MPFTFSRRPSLFFLLLTFYDMCSLLLNYLGRPLSPSFFLILISFVHLNAHFMLDTIATVHFPNYPTSTWLSFPFNIPFKSPFVTHPSSCYPSRNTAFASLPKTSIYLFIFLLWIFFCFFLLVTVVLFPWLFFSPLSTFMKFFFFFQSSTPPHIIFVFFFVLTYIRTSWMQTIYFHRWCLM